MHRGAGAVGLAVALLLAGTLVQAQKNTADGIAEYRKMLEDGNPADLFEAKGEALWKQKRGPKNATLEACDLGKGAGVVKGAFAVPAVEPGAHTVSLDGTDPQDVTRAVSMPFAVVASTTSTTTLTPSGGAASGGVAGPLALTGVESRDLASLAVLLLAAGCLFLDASLRRRAVDR